MIVKEAGNRSCRNRSCNTGYHKEYYVVIVHLLRCAGLFVTPWTATHQVPLYSTTSWSLLKYMSIESVMVSNYLILCCPHLLLIPGLPRITVFSNGFSYQMAKILEYQHQSFQWIFRVTFLSVWMVGSPCSPRDSQESSPARHFKSISPLTLSFLYIATLTSVYDYWKTIVLTIWTFVGKLMSLLFNRLSRFVRAFLPRRKCLLISWLLSPSAVLLELKKRKSVTASTFPPSFCREVMRPVAIIFVFWMLSFKPAFSFSFLPISRGSLVPLHFLPLEWYQLYFWGCWYFPSNLDYSLWFIQPGISHDVLCMEVK